MSDSGVVWLGSGALAESRTGLKPTALAELLFGADCVRVVPNAQIDNVGALIWPENGVPMLWIAAELEERERERAVGRLIEAHIVGLRPDPQLARTSPYLEEPVPSSASASASRAGSKSSS